MKVRVISQIQSGEEVLIGTRGAEEIELELNEVTNLSESKNDRYIGLFKRGIFRLTLNSYKQIKRELINKGILWRFDLSKRA